MAGNWLSKVRPHYWCTLTLTFDDARVHHSSSRLADSGWLLFTRFLAELFSAWLLQQLSDVVRSPRARLVKYVEGATAASGHAVEWTQIKEEFGKKAMSNIACRMRVNKELNRAFFMVYDFVAGVELPGRPGHVRCGALNGAF